MLLKYIKYNAGSKKYSPESKGSAYQVHLTADLITQGLLVNEIALYFL